MVSTHLWGNKNIEKINEDSQFIQEIPHKQLLGQLPLVGGLDHFLFSISYMG